MAKNKIIILFYGIFLLCFFIVLGCQADDNLSSDQVVKEIKAHPVITIEPLKPIHLQKSVAVTHWERRDPFKLSNANNQTSLIEPKRVTEDPLGFKLVGLIEKDDQKWALILVSSGKLVKVAEGGYLEPFHCQITAITQNGIGIIQQNGHQYQLSFTRSLPSSKRLI
jgi:Tfp pilus assembly protein PilP